MNNERRFKISTLQLFEKASDGKYVYSDSISSIKDTVTDKDYTIFELYKICELMNEINDNPLIITNKNDYDIEKREEYWRGIETAYEKELLSCREKIEKLEKKTFIQEMELFEEKESILNRFVDYVLDDENIPGAPYEKRMKQLVGKFLEYE